MTQGHESAENGAKTSDELRADLDETRERVSSDVEALTNKLSPENLKAEAKQAVSRSWEEGKELVRDKLHEGTDRVRSKLHEGTDRVKETVENTENTVLGYVRQNPVPLALIGAGLGLLLLSSRKKGSRNGHHPDPSIYGRSEVYNGLDSDDDVRGSGAGGRHLDHLQERVRSGVSNVKHAAADTAHQARERLERLEHRAAEQAHHAKDLAERTWQEQPLALGALAAGVGIAIGLSIPATESENELVGQYRDRLFGTVKERARQLEEKAEQALLGGSESGGGDQPGASPSA